MNFREIAEYFVKQGRAISQATVYQRLTKYYKSIEKEKTKAKQIGRSKMDVSIEEMVALKEQGMSDNAIARYFTQLGKRISQTTVYNRLNEYYKLKGETKPKTERKSTTYYEEKNENKGNVYSNQSQSINEPKKIMQLKTNDRKLKEILMTGKSIKDYCLQHDCQEDEDKIKERMRRLKVIAEHSHKRGEQWIPDSNFLEIVRVLESIGNIYPANKYMVYLRPYISNGTCKNGNINLIQMNVFKDNKDLMTFVLSGCDLRYGEEYDIKVWNRLKREYEAKIDKYFNRLYALEQRAIKKQKEKSEAENPNQKREAKKGTNPQSPGDER